MKSKKPNFPGFTRQMPTFFRGLEKNNSREWFTPRKELYTEHVHKPMVELTAMINEAIRPFAPDFVVANPARAPYRIYRDTRFSKDKTPYKLHIGVTFPYSRLPKHVGGGYYFSVSHTGVEMAGGIYMPGPEELAAVRSAIAAGSKSFLKILADKKLRKKVGEIQGEKLKRPPKGFEETKDPAVMELVKLKQFYWYTTLPASLALTPRLLKTVVEYFQLIEPGVSWLNNAILTARAKQGGESRPTRPAPMW